jgi:NADH-quinone oxidoreductase subunit C
MDADQIAKMIEEKFPGEVLGTVTHAGQTGVMVKPELIRDICRFLHDEPSLRMDHLADLTAVDYSAYPGDTGLRFEVVYNLISTVFRHRIRLKVRVPEDQPRVDTVTEIWQTANWHERETYDLMGIIFNGHPDLRRILLPEDWVGHPLRKEYPLKGF